MNWSDNQWRFIRAAEAHGYTVNLSYRNPRRDETCPAVDIKSDELAKFARDVNAHFVFESAREGLVVFADL